jgi:hypothetical protein
VKKRGTLEQPNHRSVAICFIAPVLTVGVASILLVAHLLWTLYGVALRNTEIETLNYAAIVYARVDATMRRTDGQYSAVHQHLVQTL